jgi:hypothetical protein
VLKYVDRVVTSFLLFLFRSHGEGCQALGRSGGDKSHGGLSSATGCKECHEPHGRGSAVLLINTGKEAPSFPCFLWVRTATTLGLHPRNLLCHASRQQDHHHPAGEMSQSSFTLDLNFAPKINRKHQIWLYLNLESSLKNCIFGLHQCSNGLSKSDLCIYWFLVTTKLMECKFILQKTTPSMLISCRAVPFHFTRCTLYLFLMIFSTSFFIRFSRCNYGNSLSHSIIKTSGLTRQICHIQSTKHSGFIRCIPIFSTTHTYSS